MPSVPRTSPTTKQSVPIHYVHTTARHFVDAAGRVLLLRGVNLRFVFTWEALEHEGPGKYDYEYIEYTIRVLRRCSAFGFKAFMDPHQDVWSRFSGRSGAPIWTLLACGLNPRNFTASQVALLHFEQPDPAAYPAMIQGTSYSRFVSQTIFTLFFAGRDYAPRIIDGVNIQDWLQRRFINACGVLADAIKAGGDLYDVYIIGWDIHQKGHVSDSCPENSTREWTPQTVENWAFGALGPKRDGYVTIDPAGRTVWSSPGTKEDVGDGLGDQVNKRWAWRRAAWWPLGKCIWALHGVWAGPDATDTKGEIPILKPDYFESPPFDPSRGVVFVADYWRPHWRDYIARIQPAHPEAIFFLQPPVFVQPPPLDDEDFCGRGAYSAHYYDGLTLMTRHWNWFNADALGLLRGKYSSVLGALRISEAAIRRCLRDQLAMFKDDSRDTLGGYSVLIGKIGVPFDMDSKRSYGLDGSGKYIGDYTSQTRALDCSLNGADGKNVMNWTLWTYCPDSSHVQYGVMGGIRRIFRSGAADLLGRDRRNDGSLVPVENQDTRNRSESTLGALGTLRVGTMKHIATQSPPRAPPTLTQPFTCLEPDPVEQALRISADRLYDFVTVGARGVGALARPWPIATTGVPTCLEFDISKAQFEMRVKISPRGSYLGWAWAHQDARRV
ncbi:hypothetical protein FRC12_003109 [Ceratobasidium sp. 428]|nr:hypothetical protein FRC12_003109 [Ceratobasidium sp. 428]